MYPNNNDGERLLAELDFVLLPKFDGGQLPSSPGRRLETGQHALAVRIVIELD